MPFLITVASLKIVVNLARGTRWRPIPFIKLSLAVAEHILYALKHIPSMLHVLHYYVLRAALHDGAKVNVPFEIQVRDRRGGATISSTSSRRGTPPSDASSPVTSPRTSPITRAGSDSPVLRGMQGRPLCSLDVYPALTTSRQVSGLVPVVVFVYGGAWGSGNKWMYARLAAMLRDACGAVVVVPNYPTYPTGTMLEMIEALHRTLVWVSDNIVMYGGDKSAIWLVGHSAGAHLATLLVLRRSLAIAKKTSQLTSAGAHLRGDSRCPIHPLSMWGNDTLQVPLRSPCSEAEVEFQSTPQVAGVIALAGVFDLRAHLAWEERRCVAEVSTMRGATGGYWEAHSPPWLLQHEPFNPEALVQTLPPRGIHFFHDPSDTTVSVEQSMLMRTALLEAGASPSVIPPVIHCPFGHAEVVMGPLKTNPRLGIHPTISAVMSCVCAGTD